MSSLPRPFFHSFQNLGRSWFKRTKPAYLNSKPHFEFTVASYNVLADKLLHDHPHLYSRGWNESWILDWNYRKKNLLKEIAYSNADILCLQEVQEEHYYNWFHPRLKEYGYTGVYNKRSGNKQDGCATFYKHDIFSIDSHQLIHFYKPNSTFMDRDNVAILVFLNPRDKSVKNSPPICIGNTHLLFNKKRGDIKLAQLAHLFAEIDKHACENAPLILCGDFNSAPYSPLYDFITNGSLEFQGMSKTSISGQGATYSSSADRHRFTTSVFPSELGITHTCKWRNCGKEKSHLSSNMQKTENVDLTSDEPLHIDLTDIDSSIVETLKEMPGFLKHDLNFQSSYMHRCMDGRHEVTTCHDRGSLTVDYIYYSSERHQNTSNEPKLWLSGVLSLLSEYEIQRMGLLPNKSISSDHLLLMSSFVIS